MPKRRDFRIYKTYKWSKQDKESLVVYGKFDSATGILAKKCEKLDCNQTTKRAISHIQMARRLLHVFLKTPSTRTSVKVGLKKGG